MSAVVLPRFQRSEPEPAAFAIDDPGFDHRPRAGGKFLFAGDRKLWVRGVTYGTFRPQANGEDYPSDAVLDADFAKMREIGRASCRERV